MRWEAVKKEVPSCPFMPCKHFNTVKSCKGTQGFTLCSFKAVSLAKLNKQILSPFAIYDALSLVITKPSSFGLSPQVLIYVQL